MEVFIYSLIVFSYPMVATSLPSFKQCLGRKVLILGDVGTGKTKMTADLLSEAIETGYAPEITIIDMAPATMTVQGRRIGGRLSEAVTMPKMLRYLSPAKVETPRLSAAGADHLFALAKANHDAIVPPLRQFLAEPSPILFVNDVSIYFQSGSPDILFEAVEKAETFVANGYYGQYLAADYGTGVSRRERELMDLLAAKMDEVINLSKGLGR
jgi:hypothetical protein